MVFDAEVSSPEGNLIPTRRGVGPEQLEEIDIPTPGGVPGARKTHNQHLWIYSTCHLPAQVVSGMEASWEDYYVMSQTEKLIHVSVWQQNVPCSHGCRQGWL